MVLDSTTQIKHNLHDDKTLALAFQEISSFISNSVECTLSKNSGIEIRFQIEPAPGYSLKVEHQQLIFSGSTSVEILYAVYAFAEDFLGYCFFEPGVDRYTPQHKVVLTDGFLYKNQRPLLKKRGFIQEYPVDESNYPLADWMAKNRLNYLLTWMKYYDAMPKVMKEYYQIRGITIESGHHSFEYWIPASKYYESHPEFFGIRNNMRVQPVKDASGFLAGGQLCASHPGLRKEIAHNMVQYIDAHPELDRVTLVPNDGFGWCECPVCSKFYDRRDQGELHSLSEHVYKAQNLYHDMVADIARQVQQSKPALTITLAAYVNYVEPAKNFKLSKGLEVHFAPYWRCINHSLQDPSCPINSRYLNNLEQWRKAKSGGEINIYEYYMGVNLYASMPMIHHELIFDEATALQNAGADGLLTQYHLTHWSVYGPNFYMMAKASWGDAKSKILKMWKDLFGPDAEQASHFYKALRELQESAGPCLIPYPRALLKRTQLADYQRLHQLSKNLHSKNPIDPLRKNLVIWTEYLLRFKTLFDQYQRGEKIAQDLNDLLNWIRTHARCGVFVLRNEETLISRWLERIEKGLPWYHYGLDWEDAYIQRHDTLLNQNW